MCAHQIDICMLPWFVGCACDKPSAYLLVCVSLDVRMCMCFCCACSFFSHTLFACMSYYTHIAVLTVPSWHVSFWRIRHALSIRNFHTNQETFMWKEWIEFMIFAPQVLYTIPSTFCVSFFRIFTQVVTFFESSNFQFRTFYFSKKKLKKNETSTINGNGIVLLLLSKHPF